MAHAHSVKDVDARFVIDPITRAITSKAHKKIALIQGDHNSERFSFMVPRYVEAHDMSLCNRVEVHYINIDASTKEQVKGRYTVEDLQIAPDDENAVLCSWLISSNATQYAGKLAFLVKYKCVEGDQITYEWNTARFENISITDGIDAGDTFEEAYVDIIAQWEAETIRSITQTVATNIDAWAEAKEGELRGLIHTEAAKTNAALDVERARIDNIVALPNGSTSGDAELMDIRVSADGVVHESAGTAVRKQITAMQNAASVIYKFDIGGIANTVGTISANRTRMRTVIPYLESQFAITNFRLPANVAKSTVIAIKDDKFVADIYSACTLTDDAITFKVQTDAEFDSIGLTFQHVDGSEFTEKEVSESYVEYRSAARSWDKTIRRAKNSTMLRGILRRGAITADGSFAENGVALSTEYLKSYGDDFILSGMEGYLFLRCVGRDYSGKYSLLDVLPEEGGYRVNTANVESLAFSFYKGIEADSHIQITDDEYAAASFSYTSSLGEFQKMIDEEIGEVRKQLPAVGKKMASLGDSITYGFIPRNAAGYPGQLESYAKLTAEYFGMEFANHGISGSSVAHVEGRQPMCERVSKMPDDADIVTFMGGTNDIRNGVRLGEMADRDSSTFYGALHITMNALYEKYFINRLENGEENAKVIVCAPIKLLDAKYSAEQGEGKLVDLAPWVDAIKEVASYYGFPVMDFYNCVPLNPHLHRSIKGTEAGYTGYYNPYITDGTHPTQDGAKIMARALISFVKNM